MLTVEAEAMAFRALGIGVVIGLLLGILVKLVMA